MPAACSVEPWLPRLSGSALSADLEARGSRLLLRRGGAASVIRELVEQTGAGAVFWNRRYGLPERTLDAGVKEWATAVGIDATSHQANLLFEPWTVRTGTGGPFWSSCLAGAGAAASRPPGCPERAPAGGLRISWTDRSKNTGPDGTCPGSRAPAGFSRIFASARSVRSGSGTRSANASRGTLLPTSVFFEASSAGVSSAGRLAPG